MRIGILTLPLHANYGGILQAYALQTVLERMGHEVKIINMSNRLSLPVWKWPYSYPKRFFRKYILNMQEKIFVEQYYNHVYSILNQNTQSFIEEYIHCLNVRRLQSLKEIDFDAIVVGSDQIWRPKYFPQIADAYLEFAERWNIKRIAYAVSFGTDEWEYTLKQTKRCSELSQKFDLVTVREDSGIKLCRKYYGIDAIHVLDPTMLLEPDDYVSLVKKANIIQSKGTLLYYILDETDEKRNLATKLAEKKGLTIFDIQNKAEDENLPLKDRIHLPVEQWIRGFMDAEFVITDSFHACVFSILFNKPFIAVNNCDRGQARIKSLLTMFGLQEFFYNYNDKVLESNRIDWKVINRKLFNLRNNSLKLLSVKL